MKNIIPLVLAIGMIGPVGALENTSEGQPGGALPVTKISRSVGEKVQGTLNGNDSPSTLESRDNAMREEWKRNAGRIAGNILPGNPTSIHANGIDGIVYHLNQISRGDRVGAQWSVGVFTQAIEGVNRETRVGVTIQIPLEK